VTSELSCPPGPSTRRAGWRWLGFVIGALLLAGAVAMVVRRPDELSRAADAARSAPVWAVALTLLLPGINWLLISTVFWLLTRQRAPGRVPLPEMSWLIGSAWLLNYLPFRPGLLGRVALHRSLHGIAVADSAKVVVENIVCGGIAILLAIGGIVAARVVTGPWTAALIVAVGIAPPLLGSLLLRGTARVWCVATLLRGIDLLVWSGRYFAAALVVGQTLTPVESIALASVSQIAMLVPLAGNGLGLREWAIGVTAAALPAAWSVDAQAMSSTSGLFVDLINRAAELVVALPIGLVCSALVARRIARGRLDPH